MQNPNPQYTSAVLGATSTTQVKKGSGLVGGFVPSVTGTLALYDNAAGDASGTPLLAATTVTAGLALPLGILFRTGVTAVTAGGAAGSLLYN